MSNDSTENQQLNDETWDAFWSETGNVENPAESLTNHILAESGQAQSNLAIMRKARVIAEEIQKQVKEKKKRAKVSRNGFVYLVRSEAGHYKIGRAVNVENRMRMFHVKLPFPVTLDHTITCNDCVVAEKMLHKKFNGKRLDGEWFALAPEDVDYIKGLVNDDDLYRTQ